MTLEILFFFILISIILFLLYKLSQANKKEIKIVDSESEFLSELVDSYCYWNDKGEKEYADAYKVLINKFAQLPE